MKRAAFFFALNLGFGCGPQVDSGNGGGSDPTANDDGGDSSPEDVGPSDDDSNSESGPTPDLPDPCPEGLELCDGECVDLQTSNDHCGRCGNVCPNPYSVGMCEAGVCPPNLECGGPRTDYHDCNEVCAVAGQECNTSDWGCSGYYTLHYDGEQGLEACNAGRGGSASLQASCSDSINWEQRGGISLSLPVAVSCCCTQE